MNVELELRNRAGNTVCTLRGLSSQVLLGKLQDNPDLFKKETKNFKVGGFMMCYVCRTQSLVNITEEIEINVAPFDYFIVKI
jgi:hypothetical protein